MQTTSAIVLDTAMKTASVALIILTPILWLFPRVFNSDETPTVFRASRFAGNPDVFLPGFSVFTVVVAADRL